MHPTLTPVDQQPMMQYPYPQHHPAAGTPQTLPHDMSPLQVGPPPHITEQGHGRASPSEEDLYSPPHETSFVEEPPRFFANPSLQAVYFIPSPLDFGDKDPNDPTMQLPSERMNAM